MCLLPIIVLMLQWLYDGPMSDLLKRGGSTAWQGALIASGGMAIVAGSMAGFYAKDFVASIPIICGAVGGLSVVLAGLVYGRKADAWADAREEKREQAWEKYDREMLNFEFLPQNKEAYWRQELMDPFGNEIPEVREALDQHLAQKKRVPCQSRSSRQSHRRANAPRLSRSAIRNPPYPT